MPSTQTVAAYPTVGETVSGNHVVTENLNAPPKSGTGDYKPLNPSESIAQIFPVPGTAGKKAKT